MSSRIPLSVRQSIDDAFDKLLRGAGIPSGTLGISFSSLIEQGTDATPQFGVVNCDNVSPLSNLYVNYLGGEVLKFNQQSAASYVATLGDCVVAFSNDAIRTLTIPGGAPAGFCLTIMDNSGSVTAGHTITVSPSSGQIHGAASKLITPGTNKTMVVISDGTNYWQLSLN